MPAATLRPFYDADRNTAPGFSCVQFVADVAQLPGRAFEIFCTTAPAVAQLQFPDGSVLPFYMGAIGPYSRNYGIVGFTATGSSGTFTAWNIL